MPGFEPETVPDTVNYVGECSSGGYQCKECEGDCDDDNDCEGDLICHQRSGFDSVPGCGGEGGSRDVFGKDVCIKPNALETKEVTFVGNPCNADGTPCEVCTGDCDRDSDCAGSLRCAQRGRRDGKENVPGCDWGEGSDSIRLDNDDFCK